MKQTHNMTNVTIFRDKLSKSFEDQVMATYGIDGLPGSLKIDEHADQISKDQSH